MSVRRYVTVPRGRRLCVRADYSPLKLSSAPNAVGGQKFNRAVQIDFCPPTTAVAGRSR
jgi:hypothetical protein